MSRLIIENMNTGGLPLTSRGLLLYIAQHLDGSGVYAEADSYTAEAFGNASTKPTVQRHKAQLLKDGYLYLAHNRKWCGKTGWSPVGVGITPKGLKELALISTVSQAITGAVSQASTLTHEQEQSVGTLTHESITRFICTVEDVDDLCGSNTDSRNLGIVTVSQGALIDRIVRLMVQQRDHKREMAELAASHWAVIRPRLLKGGDIIGPNDVDGDGYILNHLLPKCACGNVVKYTHQMLGGDRVKVFLKSACDECTAAEAQRTRTVTEKEFDRLLKQGWVKFIHDGDKVPVDYYTCDGELRLKYLRELALDRCECGQPVFYELVKSDSGVHVNAGQQCGTCWSLQPATAGVMKLPVLENPPATTQAETGSREA